jgi:hypothetical protein
MFKVISVLLAMVFLMESSADDIFPSRFLPTGKRAIEKKWGKPKKTAERDLAHWLIAN